MPQVTKGGGAYIDIVPTILVFFGRIPYWFTN